MNIRQIRSSNKISYLSQNGIDKGHCQEINKTYGKFPMDGVFEGQWTDFKLVVNVGDKVAVVDTDWGCPVKDYPTKIIVQDGYIVDVRIGG